MIKVLTTRILYDVETGTLEVKRRKMIAPAKFQNVDRFEDQTSVKSRVKMNRKTAEISFKRAIVLNSQKTNGVKTVTANDP